MGLYLTIFDGDSELDGVEVGAYADFATFRDTIVSKLESGFPGSRFPTLILHSDCDGDWAPMEAASLEGELSVIGQELTTLPPVALDGWKMEVARTFGIKPKSLEECFFDIDGEPLIERLIELAQLSQQHKLPIFFQ